jgi:hypothetical protein
MFSAILRDFCKVFGTGFGFRGPGDTRGFDVEKTWNPDLKNWDGLGFSNLYSNPGRYPWTISVAANGEYILYGIVPICQYTTCDLTGTFVSTRWLTTI